VIIGIVVLELLACFWLTALLAVGNEGSDAFVAPLEVWLACAALRLSIHYLPRRPNVRRGLSIAVAVMLLAGVMLPGATPVPYLHQTLFIAAVAVIPQLWMEWFASDKGDWIPILWLAGLATLPLGFALWALANILIVDVSARSAAQGEPYCMLVSNGDYFGSGKYHITTNEWDRSGFRMFAARGGGGTGDCCQWDFHALLLTRSNKLFNWSYNSQRFERISEATRRRMALNLPTCP
jgi:hypothetical protein